MKLPPELAAYEAAEKRVNAGGEAAEAHLQDEDHVCLPPGGGVVRVDDPHRDGRVAAQVVGQVQQGKEDQRCAQHPPEPSLLVVRVGAAGPAAQLSDTVQAAVTDAQQRDEEGEGGANEGIGEAHPGLMK